MLIEYMRLKQDMGKYFSDIDPDLYYDEPSSGASDGTSGSGGTRTLMNPATKEENDLFREMQEALDEMDSLRIDDVIEKMSARKCGDDEKEYLKRLRNAVEDYDLDAAQKVLTDWWNRKNGK